MKSDIEIARSIELKKIKQVAESVGIPREEVENYGRYIAKIPEHLIDEEKVKQSAGTSYGEDKFTFHRRFPCHHLCSQYDFRFAG